MKHREYQCYVLENMLNVTIFMNNMYIICGVIRRPRNVLAYMLKVCSFNFSFFHIIFHHLFSNKSIEIISL